MEELVGNVGLGHVRYPTAGSSSVSEAQPLYTNYPFGISIAHNGNLTNTEELKSVVVEDCMRHVNTDSDSELLLNLFAEELTKRKTLGKFASNNGLQTPSASGGFERDVFEAIAGVFRQCEGGYAGLYLINGIGLVGFRDPHGIRPIVFGSRRSQSNALDSASKPPPPPNSSPQLPDTPRKMSSAAGKLDYCFASESVAIDTLGFTLIRDLKAGEAIFIDMSGNVHNKICVPVASKPKLNPCIFEYVYFARPDSIMDGVSVYESRLKMGEKLAKQIQERYPNHDIDVVIPIPDTSRTSALQTAHFLNRPFREGYIKNRYVGRTFIMPGQAARKKSVRLKLNTIKSEFNGKNVLLVDDSIVRGTTAREIIQMARQAGAKKVYFTSAAPPIRYPNIYGIDIPTRRELVAYEREEHEVAEHIGADWILYQRLSDLEDCVKECCKEDNKITSFDTSCFSGCYVTGQTIGDDYFKRLYSKRDHSDAAEEAGASGHEFSGTNGNGASTNQSAIPPLKLSKHTENSNFTNCESLGNDNRRNRESPVGGSCDSLMNSQKGGNN